MFVSEEIRHQRFKTCLECEFLNRNNPMGVRCGTIGERVTYLSNEYKLCGCFMKLKTQFKGMACPVGKWGTIDISKEEGCYLKKLLEETKSGVPAEMQKELIEFKYRLTGRRDQFTTCPPCLELLVKELNDGVRDLSCE